MTAGTVEWAPFALADGVDETTLLEASEALQSDFLARQPGFVRRELLKGEGREWIDLVYWASREAVEQAMANAAASPVCFRNFQLMAGADHAAPGAGVAVLSIRRTYASNGG